MPDLLAEGPRGGAVLVVAHGNSLRALRKHIDGIGDDDIVDLEIPTGIPFLYRLDDDLTVDRRIPGDPEAALAAPRRWPAKPAERCPSGGRTDQARGPVTAPPTRAGSTDRSAGQVRLSPRRHRNPSDRPAGQPARGRPPHARRCGPG